MAPPHAQGHLPRLDPARYRSEAVVFWTLTTERRAIGWLTPAFHQCWQNTLLHACARFQLVCPAYVLMPDHAHLLWLGCSADSDQRLAMEFFRKHTSQALAPAQWQRQAHDHILRPEEREHGAFAATARYILDNPVRAKRAASPGEYPFLGCMIPGYPEFHPDMAGYWDRFWRVYAYLLDRALPARSALSATPPTVTNPVAPRFVAASASEWPPPP